MMITSYVAHFIFNHGRQKQKQTKNKQNKTKQKKKMKKNKQTKNKTKKPKQTKNKTQPTNQPIPPTQNKILKKSKNLNCSYVRVHALFISFSRIFH
jgi:hypothetical protein